MAQKEEHQLSHALASAMRIKCKVTTEGHVLRGLCSAGRRLLCEQTFKMYMKFHLKKIDGAITLGVLYLLIL